jgi:VWFA-related protein
MPEDIYDGIESMKSPLLSAALALAVALPAFPQDDVIKVDVDIVNVLFNVRTKKNGIVGNLTKDDFEIYEDGKKQEVKYFTRESNLPLTIGMLVDVSLSQENLIAQEKASSLQFFQRVLRKQDLAFLMSFGSEAELLQDYTNSIKLLRTGMDAIRLSGPAGAMSPTGSPVPTASTPRGTIMFDAVYLAAADQLKSQVGRKVIILVTDGMDQGSRYTRERAIEAAQKSDAIIYSIFHADFRRNGYFYRPTTADLNRMSNETGGRVFEAGRTDLNEIFKEIEEDVRSQYAIGYTPSNPNKDGSFRKIEIRVKNKELKVFARKGYYANRPD